MSLPIYLYCTMAKPYLSKDIVSSGKYVLSNTKACTERFALRCMANGYS